MRSNAPKKSIDEQQKILTKWSASGLSAAAFCRQYKINYAAFCKWRIAAKVQSPQKTPASAPQFIQLAQMTPENSMLGWHIVLQLGPGVELRLSQMP